MKQKLPLCLSVLLILITITSKAQVTVPTNFSPPGTPFVGWSGAPLSTPRNLDIKNNFAALDINFFTNQSGVNGTSVQRMVIKGSGPTAGFVGIGNGFSSPQNLLHLNSPINANVYAQFTNPATGSGAANGFLVGVSDGPPATLGHAILNQQSNFPMDFFTNGIQRMTIFSAASNGNVGIGSPPFPPIVLPYPPSPFGSFKLDVYSNLINDGINIRNTNTQGIKFGYYIDDSLALCVPKTGGNNPGNEHSVTFVGVRAGFNYLSPGGGRQTFIGYSAGANNQGNNNVFVGYRTGENNSASGSVFIGDYAGWQNGIFPNSASNNTFLGAEAGLAIKCFCRRSQQRIIPVYFNC